MCFSGAWMLIMLMLGEAESAVHSDQEREREKPKMFTKSLKKKRCLPVKLPL